MASIFLAAKIEENFRRLREVINVFHHLKQKKLGRYVTVSLCVKILSDMFAHVPPPASALSLVHNLMLELV